MIRLSKDRYVDRAEDSPLCVKNRHLIQKQQFYPSVPVSFSWGICFARRRMSVGPMERSSDTVQWSEEQPTTPRSGVRRQLFLWPGMDSGRVRRYSPKCPSSRLVYTTRLLRANSTASCNRSPALATLDRAALARREGAIRLPRHT